MKMLKIFFFIFCALISTSLFAQIQVKKSIVVPFQKKFKPNFAQFIQNTKTGDFLVIWCESYHDGGCGTIKSRLMNSAGKAISPPAVLATDYWIFDPSLAYNPIRNEYLLVYDDRPDYGNRPILALRVNADGKPIGKSINLTEKQDTATSPSSNWNPRATFNPKIGGYSIVWEHSPFNRGDFELTALNLTADGKAGGPIVIKKSHGDFAPHSALGSIPLDVAFHQPSGKLLVAYYAVNPDGTENYYLATLDPLLKTAPPSASVKLIKDPVVVDPILWESASIAMHDDTAVIYFSNNQTVLRRDINAQGMATGQPVAAFNAPLNKTEFGYAKAIFSTGSFGTVGLLLAVQTNGTDANLVAQPLDSSGKPVGKPNKAFGAPWFAAFELSALPPTSTNHSFLWLGEVGGSNDSRGVIRLKLSLPD